MYIPKTDDYLKILTDDEVTDFVAINFSEHFKTIIEEILRNKILENLVVSYLPSNT